jgi:hypothetical protein
LLREGGIVIQTLKIIALPSLLTFAIVASSLMGLMSYLSQQSLQTTYIVKSLQQASPCLLCHDGSFARSALKVAWLPCEARPVN